MFDDQELHETIQAFKEMGVPKIQLQPTLDFLAAMRARTIREGNAVQRQQPTAPGPSLSLSNRLKVAA